jgi:hypothetical protein
MQYAIYPFAQGGDSPPGPPWDEALEKRDEPLDLRLTFLVPDCVPER